MSKEIIEFSENDSKNDSKNDSLIEITLTCLKFAFIHR